MAKIGRQSIFPVYLVYGNLDLNLKSKLDSWLLIAMLPVPRVFPTKKLCACPCLQFKKNPKLTLPSFPLHTRQALNRPYREALHKWSLDVLLQGEELK